MSQWGEYLCRGTQSSTPVYCMSFEHDTNATASNSAADASLATNAIASISQVCGEEIAFAEHVRVHGWAVLQINALEAAQCVCEAMAAVGTSHPSGTAGTPGKDMSAHVATVAQLLLGWEGKLRAAFDAVRKGRAEEGGAAATAAAAATATTAAAADAAAEAKQEERGNNLYRNVLQLPVGHRIDGQRHFFETRVFTYSNTSNSASAAAGTGADTACPTGNSASDASAVMTPAKSDDKSDTSTELCPSFPHTQQYDLLVLLLFWLLGTGTDAALQALLAHAGLDSACVVELCDVRDRGHMDRILLKARDILLQEQGPEPPATAAGTAAGTACADDEAVLDVSSSLLRVCCYPAAPEKSPMAFGAHTGTCHEGVRVHIYVWAYARVCSCRGCDGVRNAWRI